MEHNAYPGIKNAVLLCLLLLAVQSCLGAVFGFVIGFLGDGPESLLFGLGNIAASLAAFFIVIRVAVKRTGRGFAEAAPLRGVGAAYWPAAASLAAGMVIVLSELDNALQHLLPMPDLLKDSFTFLMADQAFVVSLVLIGIIPGLMEEIFFRGIILNGFVRRYPRGKALLMSALLFGLTHLNPWQFVPAFILGLVFAWIAVRTRSISLCVFMHVFNNTAGIAAARYGEYLGISGFNTAYAPAGGAGFQPLWFDLIGVAAVLLGAVLFKRASARDWAVQGGDV
jgi:membrane protease YdiL (CAAX protease family)